MTCKSDGYSGIEGVLCLALLVSSGFPHTGTDLAAQSAQGLSWASQERDMYEVLYLGIENKHVVTLKGYFLYPIVTVKHLTGS